MPARLLSIILTVLCFIGTIHSQSPDEQSSYFFMGRVQYSKNDGRDCASVGRNMARLMSEISTIQIRDEKPVRLTDPDLFETPFLFMNGHNDFEFSEAEIENLRIYLEHGGFLFASGCCTNPAFPEAWRREMRRVLEKPVQRLEYNHPIYRSFYRLTSIRSIHRNTEVYVEGVFLGDRLVAVLCEDGLCCAFSANNDCNVGRGISPEDGKKLALNIAVYAITH
jgi:hypothetical protein